jgi:poly-beta-1,6 N-acetyl-D-glucosamine synthase
MSSTSHIFFDPSGKRRSYAIALIFIAAILALTGIILSWILFLGSPLVTEHLAELNEQFLKPDKRKIHEDIPESTIKNSRDALVREIEQTRKMGALQKEDKSLHHKIAFTSALDKNVISSIRIHADELTAISPAWLHLSEDGKHLSPLLYDPNINPANRGLIAIAQDNGINIYPRFTNVSSSDIDSDRTRAFLLDSRRHTVLSSEIVEFLTKENFKGIFIDLRIDRGDEKSKLYTFIKTLSVACHNASKEVGVISYLDDQLKLRQLNPDIDHVVLINSYGRTRHGPASSVQDFADTLQKIFQDVPASKITIAFSSDAFKWAHGDKKTTEKLSFMSAVSQARNVPLEFDPESGTSTYRFIEENGLRGQSWILDAPFSFNTKKIATEGAVANFGIWNVGGEDPGLWELLNAQPSVAELEHVPPSSPIVSNGRGDILSVSLSGTEEGARKLHLDEQSGLITKVTYESIPTAAAVTHAGYKSKQIALTFDDGPAEPFTEEVLDILKEHKIKATFFLIGEHALTYPEITKRIYDEGHDIGNHTFTHPDLSLVSKSRITLELNAAQRALQSILGRSVLLLRPPYISENSPLSIQEFRVLSIAQNLGYTTVGISNNGRDWIAYESGPDGSSIERTGKDIAEEILSKIDLMSGNAILLHDGPKERSRSVDALAILIPELKAQGFTFVTTHELMGVPREAILPATSPSPLRLMHKFVLEIISYGSLAFNGLFIGIVVLGVLRLAIILICAILSRIKELQQSISEEDFDKARDIPVSIIIAAYNEEKVIAHTISSLLQGSHRAYEIIIVDDGSKDNTSGEVIKHYSEHPRVKLIRQHNGGKSSALNHGIQYAQYDILVCLDADTQFDADAVTHLAKHFLDPRVGAVAGNIKVGNRRSILTHWQSMEYITNISIGRRAYAYLNAILVVAGAAGAWRRVAVEQAGGYHSDSLAEDMDLTWRVRRLEWNVVNEPKAVGYTEAPEDFRSLYKQRFRWSYGALQCLWKHRSAFFKHGFFGWLGIPSVLVFGCIFELLSPLADLKILLTLFTSLTLLLTDHPIYLGSLEYTDLIAPMITTCWLYAIFFGVELLISMLAFYFDGESMRPLWLLFFQRFIYRQLMYVVACRALWKALSGWKQGWGVLQRTGSVTLPINDSIKK